MPYGSVKELPVNVKSALPVAGQKEFLKIINSTLDQYDNEGQAFGAAWAAMKKNGWQKVGDKWIKKTKQEKQLFDVDKEIFAAGIWNGDKYTEKDIDEMVKAFEDLKNKRDFPLKLGHTDKQKLLQKDGLPAAGWISKLKRVGKKLVATFTKVPKLIKDLIEKHAYKNVSAEIWWNYKDKNTGKLYPRMLSAVALLGADIPAVQGLSDFGKFYDDRVAGDDIRVYEYQQKFICQCIKCGYVMESEQHCSEIKCPECGGDMRRLERPGPGQEVNMAVWDAKFINDLPDSSFAYIKPGGEKDNEGKTTPRALRYLPFKDANGKIDLPHLRNALARLPQTNLSAAEKAKARAVLVKAAKAAGVGNYDEELQKLINEEERKMDLEEKIKQLESENKALSEQIKQLEEEKKSLTEARESAEKKVEALEEAKRDAEIKAFIEKAKEEGKIVPANEKQIEALMRLAVDEKKVKFTVDGKEVEKTQREILEDFVSGLPKLADFKEYSQAAGEQKKFKEVEGEGTEASKKLDVLVREYQDAHKDVDYKTALTEVSKEHPELVESEEK